MNKSMQKGDLLENICNINAGNTWSNLEGRDKDKIKLRENKL